MWVGGKLTFVYQYRDAHADALVTVPAKSPVQLFTSTNMEGFAIEWLPRRGRANIIQYQFLNEAKNYAQDVLSVEDPESTHNDPNDPLAEAPSVETVQAYATTRQSQLLREGVFSHRLQRRTTHKISFLTGPWALAARVGELILVENEVLRPFADDVPMSCVIESGGVATNQMIVGHVVTGTGLHVVFRAGDGKPKEAVINSLDALPGGRTRLNLATSETFGAGQPAAVGKATKITKPYLIVVITLAQEMKRAVTAIEWVPSAFDAIGPAFFDEPADAVGDAPEPEARASFASIEPVPGGSHLIGVSGDGARSNRARVWVQQDGLDSWFLIGDTTTGLLETRALSPHLTYRIAVTYDEGRGTFASPESVTAAVVVAPEFPRAEIPPVRQLTAESTLSGLRFRWPSYARADLAYYELRAGANWTTARPVYRGQLEEAMVVDPPPATTFLVALRSTSGLYGSPVAVTLDDPWSPPGKESLVGQDELSTEPGGTLNGLDWSEDDGALAPSGPEVLDGDYTAAEIDPGYVAPWDWRVEHDFTVFDDFTCAEEAGLCGDGESRWSTCAMRPPSPSKPGVAFDDVRCGDDLVPCGDRSPFAACGSSGELGDLASVRLESRAHDGIAWGPWAAHTDGVRVSRKLQVRTRVNRASPRMRVQITKLETNGFL